MTSRIGKIRIGTRRSPLALAQADLLSNALAVDCEIVEFVTTGDKKQGLGDNVARDKKDWIFELEQALLNNQIDCAIHSAKDVPIQIANGTSVIPVLGRESPNDLLISKSKIDLNSQLLKIGTSSLRRISQLSIFNSNLKIETLRGNINTRLNRLENDFNGIVLAEAGVKRLDVRGYHFERLSLESFVPASNQGILACQYLSNKIELSTILQPLVDPDTKIAFEVERKLVELLGADCHSAVGIYCYLKNGVATLNSKIYSAQCAKFTNHEFLSCKKSSALAEYDELAQNVANELITNGAKDYL